MVFHRRAGQAQTLTRSQGASRLRHVRSRILDHLRLIEDDDRVVEAQERLAVEHERLITRDHDICAIDTGEQMLAVGSMDDECKQIGCESADLFAPIAEHAHGRHDERRLRESPLLLLHQQVCKCLHRLAQAHVVGKDAAEARTAQELQPSQTLLLIRPQRRAESRRRLQGFDAREVAELFDQCAQRLAIRLERGTFEIECHLRNAACLARGQLQCLRRRERVGIEQLDQGLRDALNSFDGDR